jgi:hypothetical protein
VREEKILGMKDTLMTSTIYYSAPFFTLELAFL